MRQPFTLRRALRFAVAAVVGPVVVGLIGASTSVGCGPDQSYFWVCFDPGTGHDGTYYDANHYVNGVFDPCHCYDACGPANTCPIEVDAGPPPLGCNDAGHGDAGDGG